MSEIEEQTTTEGVTEETTESTETSILDGLSEEQVKYFKELRSENAEKRVKNKELNDSLKAGQEALNKLKEIEENKLAEEGKFKELLEAKEKELNEYKTDKELLSKYENKYKQDLEEELKGLGESTQKMILESGKSVVDQLEMVSAIKKELGVATNSPASARAGGNATGAKGEEAIMKEYQETKDPVKRAELLYEIKEKMPHVFEKL